MWAVAAALFFFQVSDPSAAALKALDEGNYEAAAQTFSSIIQKTPDDYFAHFNLALAYTYLKRDADAIAEYRRTLEIQPGLFEAELNEGILLMRGKRAEEALPLLDDAALKKPKEFRPRFFLAEACLQTGSPERAAEEFRASLELDPNAAEAHLGLGRALLRTGRTDAAEAEYRRAAELDPGLRDSLLEIANAYEKNGKASQAIALYKELPGNAVAQERLATLLLENRQYASAVERLEQAYREQPDANRDALAQAYMLNGQPAKALPLLEREVAAEPGNQQLRLRYARALRDTRQYPAATAQFREAARLTPSDPVVWNDLGTMLYLTGQPAEALAAFERARLNGGDNAGNAFFRAIILDRLKDLKPALEAYEQFLSLSQGKNEDQEFQARQRVRIIRNQLEKRR